MTTLFTLTARAVNMLFTFSLLCISEAAFCQTTELPTAQIDHMLRAEWKQRNIVAAPPVDDAGYLRRVYLDIAGVIPPPQVVEDFISDKSATKREKVVADLLDGPGYVRHWSSYWDNLLMGSFRSQVVDRGAFRLWLASEFSNNAPWNQFVFDLITASGQNSAGGTLNEAMSAQPELTDLKAARKPEEVNGAVNWTLKFQGKPEDLSGNVSRLFLGVQIQCAQCHDHKTEKWKRTDFQSFTANFINTRPKPVDPKAYMKGNVRQVDLEDISRPFQPRGKNATQITDYASAAPASLDGSDFSNVANRRKALASWIVADENPWFAEAIVNRMWSHFLGRGFVEPVDDFRPSNPAVMPEILKVMAVDFKAHNYNVKRLIRQICATQAYQLSASSMGKPGQGNLYWADYRLKAMEPDQLMDSLVQATNVMPVLERSVGSNLQQIKYQMQRQFQFLFDVDEEFEQKDFEGTIPQALMLINGGLLNTSVQPIPGTALAEVMSMQGDESGKIRSLYLRTLSREPTATETNRWISFLNARRETVTESVQPSQNAPSDKVRTGNKKQPPAGTFNPLARAAGRMSIVNQSPKQQAYEDLFWALLNSSEFAFNH